jgi:hypothetical protein
MEVCLPDEAQSFLLAFASNQIEHQRAIKEEKYAFGILYI